MSVFTSHSASRLIASSGLICALALSALVAPAATLAKSGDPVIKAASCSLSSSGNLKAKADNGRLEVEFEVDQNRANRLWNIKVWDDGQRVFSGARRTVAPSGSFTLRLLVPNRAGVDTIGARAVNATTGEVCRATLNI